MQMSKKLISKAVHLYNNPEDLMGMKKYAILDELKLYGVTVSSNSDLDSECVKEIYKCVIERIVDKYGKK